MTGAKGAKGARVRSGLAALLLTALAFGLAACGGGSSGPGISDVTLALSVNAATRQPIERTSHFPLDTGEVFVSLKVSDAAPGAKLEASWRHEGKEIVAYERDVDGTRYAALSITRPANGWPPGDYEVVLSLDGKHTKRAKFAIGP